MDKKLKLSPWHSGDVNPVNIGWYECKGLFCESKIVWRKWNGNKWMWRDIYNKNKLTLAGFSVSDKWRGILK